MGQVSYHDFGRLVDNATVKVITPDPENPPVVFEECDCALPDGSHTTEAHRITLDDGSPLYRMRGGWAERVANDPTEVE